MKHIKGKINKDTKLIGRKEILLENISGKILDIGCGEGELLIKATLLGFDIIGIDRSPIEVQVAKDTAKESNVNIKIICASTEDIPFEKESFDTIVMGEVIEHSLQPDKLIEHVLSYIKPGGKLLITTPAGLAHMDADHKCFFFTKDAIDIINKHWMFDFLPIVWNKVHIIIDINMMLNILKNVRYTVETKEYGDSIHPSLDLFITIIKQ